MQEINAVMSTTCLDLFCATLGSSAGSLFNNRCFVTLNNYTKPELPPNPLYLQPHTHYCPHNQKTKQEFCVANNSLKPKRAPLCYSSKQLISAIKHITKHKFKTARLHTDINMLIKATQVTFLF